MLKPLVLLLALAACAPAAGPPGAAPDAVRVTRIVDGDTIHVDLGGDDVTVRFIGIDTPEVRHPTVGRECFGREASTATKDLLDRQSVNLEFDRDRTDRYGRTLAYVYLQDGRMVNELLVERGFATVLSVRPNVAHEALFERAARAARSARRGLWRAC